VRPIFATLPSRRAPTHLFMSMMRAAGCVAAVLLIHAASGSDAPAQAAGGENCPELGLTIDTHISGDIPLGGPMALGSRDAIDRDVVMEEDIAGRLESLSFRIDDNAFWQFIYATDSQAPRAERDFSIRSEVQSGRQPEAVGSYRIDRDGGICSPLSIYIMNFEIIDDGARVVWRGHARNTTRTEEPVADKERMTERLMNALRSDLRQSHNLTGRGQ